MAREDKCLMRSQEEAQFVYEKKTLQTNVFVMREIYPVLGPTGPTHLREVEESWLTEQDVS